MQAAGGRDFLASSHEEVSGLAATTTVQYSHGPHRASKSTPIPIPNQVTTSLHSTPLPPTYFVQHLTSTHFLLLYLPTYLPTASSHGFPKSDISTTHNHSRYSKTAHISHLQHLQQIQSLMPRHSFEDPTFMPPIQVLRQQDHQYVKFKYRNRPSITAFFC